MKQRQINRRVYQSNPMQRLTLGTTGVPDSPWIADATPFFDRCVDEIMSLHFGGRMGLLDLFNWNVSNVFTKTFNYMTYVRPAHAEGDPTPGHLADPCADPNGFEYGTSQITLEGFGRYGRMGPVREIIKATRYCETDPRYRLDGSPVTTEFEWDMAFMMDVLKQDLFRDIIVGNSATAGKFDGLLQWINTDYDTELLNSTVVEWAGNNFAGTGGGAKTLNGAPLPVGTALINLLLAIFRRFRQRIKWSPMLATEELNGRNMVLVMPTFLAECLLDAFTCWSVCEGGEFNPVNLMTYEARNFRDSLNGGRYGAGFIRLDGQVIDIYAYDWETIHGDSRGDIYFLTLSVGNQQLWEGEHLDAAAASGNMNALGHNEYFTTDGGRIIGTTDVDNLCRQTKIWIRPRLVNRAPWLQARIMNVECETILDPLSPDPLATSFFPHTSFAGEARNVA
jgi:hypothetical protein